MHTKDLLAQALRQAGLHDMADKAAEGYYHDYLSPLVMPGIQLADDLRTASTPAAMAVLRQHLAGDFDATTEESEAWIDSPEGRATVAGLMGPKR